MVKTDLKENSKECFYLKFFYRHVECRFDVQKNVQMFAQCPKEMGFFSGKNISSQMFRWAFRKQYWLHCWMNVDTRPEVFKQCPKKMKNLIFSGKQFPQNDSMHTCDEVLTTLPKLRCQKGEKVSPKDTKKRRKSFL